MNKIVKKLSIFICLFAIGCSSNTKNELLHKDYGRENKDIVVLSTNDTFGNLDEYLGYDGLKDFMDNKIDKKENYVTLVDVGGFSSCNDISVKSKGKSSIDIMNKLNYDIVVPGTHEFDYGLDVFFKNMKLLGDKVISCNIIDPDSKKLHFPPYKIFKYGDTKVAYVGVTSPETFYMNDEYFFDKDGKQTLSFFEGETSTDLCTQIQKTVDSARAKGANKVILIAGLGNKEVNEMWSSLTIIANTIGVDAVIDGHSGEIMEEGYMTNRNGAFVPLVQAGTNLQFIGAMNITKDGFLNPAIISKKSAYEKDPDITKYINELKEKYK